ncbi:MAG: LytR C-terminal domain-containing protein [Ilumatobacteraceae bacterium]
MTRTWPAVVAVVVVGALAGVAVAGLPGEADTLVIDAGPGQTTTAPSSTVAVPANLPTTTPPNVTSPRATTTTTTMPEVRDRADIRVVLANGAGIPGLVSANAERLRVVGYVDVTGVDVRDRPGRTTVYVREGFESEGDMLADDLDLDDPYIVGLPDEPVTPIDDDGDLIVVLAPDAPR